MALSLVFFSSFARAAWDLNDLSQLLPLPAPGEESLLLSPFTNGWENGPLIPASVYQALPLIVVGIDKDFLYQRALRVVGIRIDPCFQEGSAPAPCRRQVRFVWQPLAMKGNAFSTEDAALHTFHALDETQWSTLVAGLRALKDASPFRAIAPLPLQIQPRLRAEGYRGPYWRGLRELLLSVCGPRNLIRATAMTTNRERTVWVFTGFDVRAGRAERVTIPGVSPQKAQAVFINPANTSEFRLAINPPVQGQATFLNVLNDSQPGGAHGSEGEAVEAVRRALVLENPRFTNSGTVDCASCHAARALTPWAQRRFPQWNWRQLFPREMYQGPGNLAITTPATAQTNVLRSFGYIDAKPVISSRVIQETSVNLTQMP